MKFKNLSKWELKPELSGLLFFAQRLDELLWDYTLDTNKPSALNAPYLCLEAINLISDIESGLIDENNLKHVIEELLWSVRSDFIAKSLLDLPIENYILDGENSKLSDRKLRLETLQQTINPQRYLNECLNQIIKSVVTKEKNKVDFSTKSLITTLINMGMSKRHIHQKTNSFFFSPHGPQINSSDQIDEFLKTIYPYSHNFTIYFKTKRFIETVSESIPSFKINIIYDLPPEIEKFQIAKDFICEDDEIYAEISDIHGLDAYSAYETAANKLDMLSDLFTLFHHKKKIAWNEQALITQCCQEAPVIIGRNNNSMEKAFDLLPEKASKQLNNFIQNFAIRGVDFQKFNRVVDLHGICVASEIIDNQLVNLWTSFETLVPAHNDSPKIQRIIEGVMPFLNNSYLHRIVQRFQHDLITWNKWTTKKLLNQVQGFDRPNLLHRTLALLCLEENEELRRDLYEKLKDFELLRNRAFNLSQILSDPRKVEGLLDNHDKKLKWQIRRIYRTRNLIVHSGSKPSYIHTLVENGHDYLDQLLFDVMKYSCGEYRVNTLEQVFDLAKVRHQNLRAQLSSITKFTPDNCKFICNEFNYINDYIHEPWIPKK